MAQVAALVPYRLERMNGGVDLTRFAPAPPRATAAPTSHPNPALTRSGVTHPQGRGSGVTPGGGALGSRPAGCATVVGYAGRLVVDKNPLAFVRAAAAVQAYARGAGAGGALNACFVATGSGPMEQQLRAEAERLGAVIHWRPGVSADRMPEVPPPMPFALPAPACPSPPPPHSKRTDHTTTSHTTASHTTTSHTTGGACAARLPLSRPCARAPLPSPLSRPRARSQ
jgi:glycosyltransferase involved in cell wall biosynthesis